MWVYGVIFLSTILVGYFVSLRVSSHVLLKNWDKHKISRKAFLRGKVQSFVDYDVLKNYNSQKTLESFLHDKIEPLTPEEEQFVVEEYKRRSGDIATSLQRKAELEQFFDRMDDIRAERRTMIKPSYTNKT